MNQRYECGTVPLQVLARKTPFLTDPVTGDLPNAIDQRREASTLAREAYWPPPLCSRVANLLVRSKWPPGHVEEIAAALRPFFKTAEIAALRRALKPTTPKQMDAIIKEGWREERAQWRKEHPGRRITDKAVVEWRKERNRAALRAEEEDWERDHPGRRFFDAYENEHDQRGVTDFERWERQRARKLARNRKPSPSPGRPRPSRAQTRIAYYRVSTGKQGKSGLGIAAQRQAVANYLNGGNWRIIAEFTEVESGKRSDRPALDKALAAARVRQVPLVVAKVDRLTRSVAFLSRLLEAGVDGAVC